MLLAPGERQITPEAFKQKIESIKKEETSTLLVAETAEHNLTGY